MSERLVAKDLAAAVAEVCQACGKDPHRLMDIVRGVQKHAGHISGEAMSLIAGELGIPRVEVESVVSFYSFYSDTPQGRIVIRLCNDVIDRLAGADGVAQVF
ncbi:MAG: NADH:ubiquinone oxidoreductase, partial [Gemmatimonadetes bacterium]|nr:NADH:ubiquinone oxidoreductase [Gemmatimonadota bacterium]